MQFLYSISPKISISVTPQSEKSTEHDLNLLAAGKDER